MEDMTITSEDIDVLVLGAGPAGLAITVALCKENLRVAVLSDIDPKKPWPYTYGIWGDEVDELGLEHLLEHRWSKTVSYFGQGSSDTSSNANYPTRHKRDYGLFDKRKLQNYWLNKCKDSSVKWERGKALNLEVDSHISHVITDDENRLSARIIIDATGYKPALLKSPKNGPVAVQTCYGVVGRFNYPPVEQGQFVLMDYRCDHLTP